MTIEKNAMNENAIEIRSKAHRVRTLREGGKTVFSVCDILSACGVKAPTKWIERNMNGRPDMVITKFDYPTKTAKGYRKTTMFFCTAAVGKKIIQMTACLDETERWLTEEVFTYKAGVRSTERPPEFEKYEEWAKSLWRNLEVADAAPSAEALKKEAAEEDINRRIDKILLELLEIKRCVVTGTTA